VAKTKVDHLWGCEKWKWIDSADKDNDKTTRHDWSSTTDWNVYRKHLPIRSYWSCWDLQASTCCRSLIRPTIEVTNLRLVTFKVNNNLLRVYSCIWRCLRWMKPRQEHLKILKKKYNKHCDFRDTIKTYQMLEFDGC
jgi:hypothetical protein